MSIWDAQRPGARPGIHLLEVESVAASKDGMPRRSKKGDLMWEVKLRLVKYGGNVTDYYMQEGNGAWFTQQRLIALGFTKEQGDPLPEDLIGRRVWALLEEKEETYNGETRVRIQISTNPKNAEGKIAGHFSGYWPEASPPGGADEGPSVAPVDENSVPF